MRKKISLRISCFVLLVVLVSIGYSYAGNIDVAQSSWNANQVVLRITNVPQGTRVTANVYVNSGCQVRAFARSAPAPADGVVNLIIPQMGGAFIAGDKVRISDPDCAELIPGGTLQLRDCATVCPDLFVVPSLTQWGLIVLAALIVVTGVYLWMRRKPAAA